MDVHAMERLVEDLEKESDAIRKEALQLTWAMRGGVQYETVLNMSEKERRMIAEISKENIEITNKVGLPFF